MKTNELMIGDWVYSAFSEKPCKVEGIEWTESEYAYVNICGVNEYKCIESLSPIPLTQEILEKNGFICDGESWWYQDFRIALSKSKGVSLVCGRQKRFEFVHQLQHALRLCGIEKEIEL